MKQIVICFFLTVILLTIPALAEETDYTQMSLDELIIIKNTVTAEINKRLGFSDDTIGSGVYIVGVDIKPGAYELICSFKEQESINRCGVEIYQNDVETDRPIFSQYGYEIGQQLKIDLSDGNLLVIKHGNFLIQPCTHSFAP